MAGPWYVKAAGEELGPLTSEQLKTLAHEGEISAGTPISRSLEGPWVPAIQVKGLVFAPGLPNEEPAGPDMRPIGPPDEPAGEPDASWPPEAAEAAPSPAGQPRADIPLVPAPPVSQSPPISQAPPVAGAPPVVEALPATPGARPPVPPVPPPPGPFHVELQAPTAAAAPTGRPRAGSESQTEGRKKNVTVVAALGSVLVVLVAVLAAVILRSRIAGTAARAPDRVTNEAPLEDEKGPHRVINGAPGEDEEQPEDEVLADLDKYLGEVGPKDDAQTAPDPTGKPAGSSAAPGAGQWTDASTSSVQRGDVAVRITSAEIGRPRLVHRSSGMVARPRKDCLSVRLDLYNQDKSKKREYLSWNVQSQGAEISLVDDRNNRYPMKSFRRYGLEIEGQVEGGKGDLNPEEVTKDVLVFEKPAEGAAYLRLELPAAAFGEKGSLRFEIPISMVAATPEPSIEKPEPSIEKTEPPMEKPGKDADRAAPREPLPDMEDDGGPIPIPGLTDQPSDDDAPPSFDDDPRLRKAREELWQRRAQQEPEDS